MEQLQKRDNVSFALSTVVEELLGETALSGLRLRNTETGVVMLYKLVACCMYHSVVVLQSQLSRINLHNLFTFLAK